MQWTSQNYATHSRVSAKEIVGILAIENRVAAEQGGSVVGIGSDGEPEGVCGRTGVRAGRCTAARECGSVRICGCDGG